MLRGTRRPRTSPLHVAVVTPPPDSSGGIGRLVGYEAVEWTKDPEVAVVVLDSRGAGSVLRSVPVLLRCLLRIARLRMSGSLDLVHVNVSTGASTARKSIVVWMARLLRVPVVLHLHGSGYNEFFRRLPAVARGYVSATFRAASHVVVLGHVWRDFVIGGLGVSVSRVTVLSNASPEPPASGRAVGEECDRERLRVAFVGRVGDRKGTYRLLEAIRRRHAAGATDLVHIAGDGDLAHLRQVVAEMALEHSVRIHGWMSPEDVRSILEECDILALPSLAENQPLSIIEAMSYSVPSVASRVGAIDEVVTDGVDGWLIDPLDVDALVKALGEASDRTRLREASAAARRAWSARFAIGVHWAGLKRVWLGVSRGA